MVFQPMTIREIHGGAGVAETSFALQVKPLHELRLGLRDRSVVVRGRVVSSSISEVDQQLLMYRSALEFIESPSTLRHSRLRAGDTRTLSATAVT